jgi:hypothetical protein
MIFGVWLLLGVTLSAITYRIADWYKLPDEMVYQRLALSIARTHSLVPRIHGEFIRSLNQLYPLLISPIVAHGYVADDLPAIHILNAFVVTSAFIPAYLLARRVSEKAWVGYFIGLLSVTLPWLVLTPFMLTEVVALPAFLWAMVGFQRALTIPSARNDVIALAAIALAFEARTEFVLLLGVLPLAIVAFQFPREASTRTIDRVTRTVRSSIGLHRVLTAFYGAALLVALAYVLDGGRLLSLSIYGQELSSGIPSGVPGRVLGHLADLAFSVGILPFLVGTGWMLANVIRRSATTELQAFACIATATVVLMTYEATTFDIEVGGFIFDRYLFYLVPLLLLGFTCALLDVRRPRWSLVLPVCAVALGFALHMQRSYTWDDEYHRLNTDSPIAYLYKPIVDAAGGTGGAQIVLIAATIVLAGLFVAATAFVRRDILTAALLVLIGIALPVDTASAFQHLFKPIDYAERPLTHSNAGTLDWIDRSVGTDAQVSIVPYPVSTAFFVTQNYWRDAEFWNKSVTKDILYPNAGVYSFSGVFFPKTVPKIDAATGAMSVSPTRYAVESINETRFWIDGKVVVTSPHAYLIDAGPTWRLAWSTTGLFNDGWTRPGVTAVMRVYPRPGQKRPLERYVSFQFQSPVAHREVTIESNLEHRRLDATDEHTAFATNVLVCVSAHNAAEVRVSVAGTSDVPGDQDTLGNSLESRRAGVNIADISVADEFRTGCN